MSTVIVRLDFTFDCNEDNDDYRKTLSRNIPAPLRHIVNPTIYEEFCSNIDQVFVPSNKNCEVYLSKLSTCFDVAMAVLCLLRFLIQFELPDIVFVILRKILWGCLIIAALHLLFFLCNPYDEEKYQMRSIQKICNDMTTLHKQWNTTFHLRTETRSDGEGGTVELMSHIEVHVVTNQILNKSDYLVQIKIVFGRTMEESMHIERTVRPILELNGIGRSTYETFLDEMDHLLLLLHNAKVEPDYFCLYCTIYCMVSGTIFACLIVDHYSLIIVLVILFIISLRWYPYYGLHVYKTQRRLGIKSKIDVVKDIRTLLDDEMSCISPNVSFHISRTIVGASCWQCFVIHAYVSPFPNLVTIDTLDK